MKFPWVRSKPTATATPPPSAEPQHGAVKDIASAHVILSTNRMPKNRDIVAAIRRRVPEFTPAGDEAQSDAAARALVGFGVRGADMVTFMFVAAPNPLSPNDSCVNTAWWWPDDWTTLRHRKGHVIIFVPHPDPKQRTMLLAQLAAAVVESTDAVAVIWNQSDSVWKTQTFMAFVDQQPGKVPTMLAVAMSLGDDTENRRPDGTPTHFAITTGMAEFGLMEMEVRGYPGDHIQMYGRLMDLAGYLIDKGPVVGDGHTIGQTAGERFQVRQLPSTVRPGTKVYRIHFDPVPG